QRRAREGAKEVEGCCCAGGPKSNCCRPCGLSGPREGRRRVRARALARVARIRCERVDANRRGEAAMSIRDEIAHLCREHDRLMAEHDEWMARREAAGSSPMRESEPVLELVFKTIEDATPPAPQPEPQPSSDEPSLAYAVKEFAAATSRRFDRLEHAHAELRGQVSALLTLLGLKEFKAGEIIDLPDWRSRRDVA